jgi:hypothetical protein
MVTSSTEAELVAAVECCKTILWLQELINEIGLEHNEQSTIYQDNKSVIWLVTEKSRYQRSKHMLIKLNFIKQLVELGKLVVEHLQTDFMSADALTKALQGIPRQIHCDRISGNDQEHDGFS